MLKLIALATISVPLLVIGLLLGSSWVVVDVQPEDGPRLFIPAPLLAARAVLPFVPQEIQTIEIPDAAGYSDLAERVLAELSQAPDGVLVEIDDREQHVHIEKRGAELLVEVTSNDEAVSVHLPIELAIEVVRGVDDERVELLTVLAAISRAPHTELLHLRTDEEEVKVWIW